MLEYLILLMCILLFICFVHSEYEEMTNIEYISKYNWNKFDIKARKGYNCNPIKKIYVKNKYRTHDYWIYIMPKSCEEGLPHTISSNIIAIPDDYPLKDLSETIKHEKVHLNQKLYPEDWKKFYEMYWDYELFQTPPSNIPDTLLTKRRTNPDTYLIPFARWNKKWWSIPVYNTDNIRLQNCSVKWWNEETNETTDIPPKKWEVFFGKVNELEHPHEISAEYIATSESSESSTAKRILLNKWNSNRERLGL